MMKIGVLGDGGWGTALACLLIEKGHAVTVWGPDADYLEEVRNRRENVRYLPGVKLPSDIRWTADIREFSKGADALILAVPSRYFRKVVAQIPSQRQRLCPVLSATKGLDEQTGHRMSEVAAELLGDPRVAALSGPTLAAEVARGVPTAVTVASTDPERALFFQNLLNGPTFRVYTATDVIGVELGGALKNVIALAAGVCDGIGFGDNSKAALITRGLAEMTRLGVKLGANAETFSGLSGLGDLVATCTSRLSRNRGVGEQIGRGRSLAEILATMHQVAEGVWTCRIARRLAREMGVEMPITEEVYAILYEGKSPREAVLSLMSREPKSEQP